MTVLRASGRTFDVDAFLASSKLVPCEVARRGEPVFRTKPNGRKLLRSHLHVSVSEADWGNWKKLVSDSLRFISSHERELRRLVRYPGVEGVELDFPTEVSESVWEGHTYSSCLFPQTLVAKAGSIGLELAFTIYTGQREP